MPSRGHHVFSPCLLCGLKPNFSNATRSLNQDGQSDSKTETNEGFTWQPATVELGSDFLFRYKQNQQQGCEAGIPETAKNASIDPSFCKKGQHVDVAFHRDIAWRHGFVEKSASTFAHWKEKGLAWKPQAFCVFCASAWPNGTQQSNYLSEPIKMWHKTSFRYFQVTY